MMKSYGSLYIWIVFLYCIPICFLSCEQPKKTPMESEMYQKLQSIKKADKNDEPINHMDTLITQLVDYYEHTGSKLKLAEAYYYAGRVYSERQEIPLALDFFHKAADALPESDSPILGNVIYSQMGYIFSHQGLHNEAVEAFTKSYREGLIRNDTLIMVFGLRDIALEYRKAKDYNQSELYLRKATKMVSSNKKYPEMFHALTAQFASLCLIKGDSDKALRVLQSTIGDTELKNQSGTYTIASKIYMAVGMVDSAEYYSRELLKVGTLYAKCSANERLAEIAVLRKQPEQALRYLTEYKRLNDSINSITNMENIAKIHAMYNYQKREQENAKLREENQQKTYYLIVAIIVIIALSLICVIGGLLYRKHRKTLWLKSELLEGVKRQQVGVDKQLAEEKLAQLQVTNIGKLIFKMLDDTTDNKKRLTEDDWKDLEQTVNTICPRFSERLRGLSELNEYELRVCLLKKIGVAPSKIALLLNKSKQAINSTRERLYKKAFGQKGTPSMWDDYLQTL